MIPLIIKSYFALFISLAGSLLFLFLGIAIWFRFLVQRHKKKQTIVVEQTAINQQPSAEIKSIERPLDITTQEIAAIAGEDAIATQLDLARAYIETGLIQTAKKIMHSVLENGTEIQKQEAQRLMDTL